MPLLDLNAPEIHKGMPSAGNGRAPCAIAPRQCTAPLGTACLVSLPLQQFLHLLIMFVCRYRNPWCEVQIEGKFGDQVADAACAGVPQPNQVERRRHERLDLLK